jgi:NADPH-dependent 2,4-dienoyl-CoA reductase/sulfur reductase-like enzyme
LFNGNLRSQNQKEIISLGVQGTNAISVFGWKLAATGLNETVLKAKVANSQTDSEKEKWEYESCFLTDNVLPEFMKKNEKILIKVIWNKKRRNIVGAQIASKENHAETIYFFSLAILKKLTIDELPLVDLLFLPHFNKPYNFVTMLGLKALGFVKKEETQTFTRKDG